MAFSLENEMIPIIKSKYTTILNKESLNRIAYAEELPVNHRIVDLLFAPMQIAVETLNNNSYKKSFKKLNMAQLDVLSIFLTNPKGVSIQKLIKILRMKPDKIHDQYLELFLELGLIQKVSRYSYISTGWTNVFPLYVVAIEAKLTKWQEALEQAIYNLTFADYSYVAMDNSVNFKDSIIEKFIEANIGLIRVSEENDITVVYEPKRNKLYRYSDFRLQRLRLCRDLICKNSKWNLIQ
ncbi:hypothetical protein QYF48_17325 [Brevibacillus agri]|uniref:hypothetical protein n=1 Tax=Brevibacillus agri TaxID=51101 RepID=UPI0002A4F5BD|nr:hypothetical protein [Brevibacillus agri]ELK41459.1 hypothetical protein D478_13648 [Brevibacillus agri BAB-2500]MDN4094571.1 hypothetical protein [Brevibacillus agri]